MGPQRRFLWRAFLRSLIVFLGAVLLLALFFAFNPGVLETLIRSLNPPGVVDIPDPGPTLPPPQPPLADDAIPTDFVAYSGMHAGQLIGCSFLLELEDGQKLAVSAAHATPELGPGNAVTLYTPDQVAAARLESQLERGRAFTGSEFRSDYVLWSIAEVYPAAHFLQPDPRGKAAPGEPVVVFGPGADGSGGSLRRLGTVMSSSDRATWIQLEESFHPGGYSGCPVVSRVTGRLVGMAVAGADKHPVVMGLHPVGSLVEKALAALSRR